jgi:hypothetical protein
MSGPFTAVRTAMSLLRAPTANGAAFAHSILMAKLNNALGVIPGRFFFVPFYAAILNMK